jgi:hypothetical protein
MIEKRKTGVVKLSNVDAENLVINAIKGQFSKEKKYSDCDLDLMTRIILELNPNHYYKEHLKNLSEFILFYFSPERYTELLKKMISQWYKPGRIVHLLRVHNAEILYFASLFDTIAKKYGIVLNITYVGDMSSIFTDIEIDQDTGDIKSTDIKERFDLLLSELKTEYPDLIISSKGDVYTLLSDNKDIIDVIGLKFSADVEIVPEFIFI